MFVTALAKAGIAKEAQEALSLMEELFSLFNAFSIL